MRNQKSSLTSKGTSWLRITKQNSWKLLTKGPLQRRESRRQRPQWRSQRESKRNKESRMHLHQRDLPLNHQEEEGRLANLESLVNQQLIREVERAHHREVGSKQVAIGQRVLSRLSKWRHLRERWEERRLQWTRERIKIQRREIQVNPKEDRWWRRKEERVEWQVRIEAWGEAAEVERRMTQRPQGLNKAVTEDNQIQAKLIENHRTKSQESSQLDQAWERVRGQRTLRRLKTRRNERWKDRKSNSPMIISLYILDISLSGFVLLISYILIHYF